mgnify:CR=1 FL=1
MGNIKQGTWARLLSLELNGFKNIEHGILEMPACAEGTYRADRAEVLGIYGQNGSGKTAVMDALFFLRRLLCGEALPGDTGDFIAKQSETAACTAAFLLGAGEETWIAEYSFSLIRREDRGSLGSECLTIRRRDGDAWTPKTVLLRYDALADKLFFRPVRLIRGVGSDGRIALEVARRLSLREAHSFFFSSDVRTVLNGQEADRILELLGEFGRTGLFVIRREHVGVITLNAALPISFRERDADGALDIGETKISLTEPTVLPQVEYGEFRLLIEALQTVISLLIPGMGLEIREYGGQIVQDGREGIRFELLSIRGDARIPIRYESEGIKKILSVLSLLIAVYNESSVCVAIDELDAGIYEYLLGELLQILEESGRGQLLFTSHNLRPLEMIGKNGLIFTTANARNRYVRLTGTGSGNLRDSYLRSIHLGGQKESMYESADSFRIARAMRKAGGERHG